MASQHEIACIKKSDRYNPYERITHVGGQNGDGSRWQLAQKGAIAGIEASKWVFFVKSGQQRAAVIVAQSRYGHKYLKTAADGEQPNNLLSLPECL